MRTKRYETLHRLLCIYLEIYLIHHGQLWDAEMVFDRKTGKIKSVLVQNSQSTGLFKKGYMDLRELPWSSIVIIGDDMIIFKSDQC